MTDHHSFTNKLIHEKSPYLLQHAHNPVNWQPWGESAFQSAKDLDKPIFLSIGYATCHWCHVMERESFENIEIAKLLNDSFICIKVDREELPEVDNLYMDFAQSMMAGAAGWPLNVILTPELEPFFAATYLPSYSQHGMMGLNDLILRIDELWKGEEKGKILLQAEKIVEMFADSIHVKGEDIPDFENIAIAADIFFKMADPTYGGIKGAPKFPIGYQAGFLLRYYAQTKDNRSLFLVERTLDMMHRGGIYDHLGGGFSRYSVDEKWLVPHFEKMLYDNAILAQSYLEAWLVTKNPMFKQVCEETLDYILRDMTFSEGGFYSAEDADSEGHEGKFYTWTYQEVIDVLGEEEAELFCDFYSITPDGNFEGRNILNTPIPLKEFATTNRVDPEKLQAKFALQKKKLWQTREKRVHPFKDDKILSAWNGLMIHVFAEAGLAFSNPKYVEAANKSARFIYKYLWKDQKLLRRWRDGEAKFAAGLDEHAFLIRGLLTLFECNCSTDWLVWAIEMTQVVKNHFKEEGGAFYQVEDEEKDLILRKCQFSDGAEPSGNAIHCENLLRLYHLTGQEDYRKQAEDILKAVQDYLENYHPGYIYHVMNLQYYYNKKAPTIVIALNSKKELEEEIKQLLYQNFILHRAIIWQHHDIELEELISFLQDYTPKEDRTTMYICYEGVCQKPLTNLEEMKTVIQKI